MKTTKLKLDALKVESFVTAIKMKNTLTIAGGMVKQKNQDTQGIASWCGCNTEGDWCHHTDSNCTVC